MPTVVEGDFEWDSGKAQRNLSKHGVSFPEAATVFADPLASLRSRVLCVVHIERGERDRIISARRATAGERDVYAMEGR